MYKTKTLTELNAVFVDIFEYNIELHDSGTDSSKQCICFRGSIELFGGM